MESKIQSFFKSIRKSIKPNRQELIQQLTEQICQDIVRNPVNGIELSNKEIEQVILEVTAKVKVFLEIRKKFHTNEIEQIVKSLNSI